MAEITQYSEKGVDVERQRLLLRRKKERRFLFLAVKTEVEGT